MTDDTPKPFDARQETIDRTKDLGRDAVQIAKWSVVIYPACIVLGLIAGGIGAYVVADMYVGTLLTVLAVLAGIPLGGVFGFWCAGAIVAGMFGDLVFDAGWQATKIGWKANKHRRARKRGDSGEA